MKSTSPPARAAAIAWFEPLPPGMVENPFPITVSPGFGSRSTVVTRSMLALPNTAILGRSVAVILPSFVRGVLAEGLPQYHAPRLPGRY